MEQKLTLVKKLAEVMAEVKYIQKRGKNKFHNYNYATESDVADAIREKLAERSIMMIPSVLSSTMREHINRNKQTEYITKVNMEFRFMDGESGEVITFFMEGEGQDAGDKGIYKAMTGAQKYALLKAFQVPTGDDPEGDTSVDERNNAPSNQQSNVKNMPTKLATEPQQKVIHAVAGKIAKIKGMKKEEVLEKFGITNISELTSAQASSYIEKLNAQVAKLEGVAQ